MDEMLRNLLLKAFEELLDEKLSAKPSREMDERDYALVDAIALAAFRELLEIATKANKGGDTRALYSQASNAKDEWKQRLRITKYHGPDSSDNPAPGSPPSKRGRITRR